MRILTSLTICLLIVIAGVGCQGSSTDPGAPSEVTPTVPPLSTPVAGPVIDGGIVRMSPTLPRPFDPGVQDLIDKALADLSERLSIPASEITLLDATPVVWSDSSLGCPQPGMAYIQVPEDGLLIRLQVGDQIYTYHSGGVRDPFLCEQIYKDPPPPKIDFFNLTPPAAGSGTPDNSIPPGGDK